VLKSVGIDWVESSGLHRASGSANDKARMTLHLVQAAASPSPTIGGSGGMTAIHVSLAMGKIMQGPRKNNNTPLMKMSANLTRYTPRRGTIGKFGGYLQHTRLVHIDFLSPLLQVERSSM